MQVIFKKCVVQDKYLVEYLLMKGRFNKMLKSINYAGKKNVKICHGKSALFMVKMCDFKDKF